MVQFFLLQWKLNVAPVRICVREEHSRVQLAQTVRAGLLRRDASDDIKLLLAGAGGEGMVDIRAELEQLEKQKHTVCIITPVSTLKCWCVSLCPDNCCLWSAALNMLYDLMSNRTRTDGCPQHRQIDGRSTKHFCNFTAKQFQKCLVD